MKKIIIACAALMLTACEPNEATPQNVVVKVAQVLQKEDARSNKRLSRLVLNDARQSVATAESRAELRALLSPVAQLKVGSVTLLKEEKPTRNDSLTLHSVQVLKNDQEVLTLEVKCLDHFGKFAQAPEDDDLQSLNWDDANDLGHLNDHLDHLMDDVPSWYQTCRVSKITE